MSHSVDRALVEELLNDSSLSYREIARQAGCSDWTVRSLARDLTGDPRPMKEAHQNMEGGVAPFVVGLVLLAVISGMFWLAFRTLPPQNGSADQP